MTMHFGNTPIYPLVQYDDLRGSEIVALPNNYYGSLDERRYLDLLLTQYALYDVSRDSLLAQGDFMDPTGTQIQGPGVIYDDAPPAEYRLELMKNSKSILRNLNLQGKSTCF